MRTSDLCLAVTTLCKRGAGGICECVANPHPGIPLNPPFTKGEAEFNFLSCIEGRGWG